MLKYVLLTGVGGFVGSALRYAASVFMASLCNGFPWGTMLVNALGSFAIGVVWAAVPFGGWHVAAMAGFCGGFTTFSTFSLEALRMFRAGQCGMAVGYIAASVAVCMLLTWLGIIGGMRISGRAVVL